MPSIPVSAVWIPAFAGMTATPSTPCFAQPVPRFRAFVESRLHRRSACRIVQSPGAAADNHDDTMKNALKLTVLAAALAAGAFVTMPASFAQPQETGNATERRAITAFSAIELAGPYHVVIDAQAKPSLELSGERKQLADIETVVRGDTLVVRPVQRNGFFFNFGKRRETVTVRIGASALKRLTVAGSGDVEIDRINAERFTLAGNGPGDVHASGTVRQLTVTSSGSGDLELQHLKAGDVDLALNGPGDVELADVSGTLSVQAGGSGDLEADGLRASKVTARMRGPGNVKLSGSARELDLEMSGSGDFEGCDLRVDGGARSVQRGPGNACLAGAIRKFDGEVDGSGELAVRGLQAGTAQLRMNGPGNVALAGTVGDLNVELAGSGDLDAAGLKASKATVRARGPGGVTLANVGDTLDAALSGSGGLKASMSGKRLLLRMNGPGDARIDGNVAQVDAQIAGSGSLDGHGLTAAHADIVVHGPGTASVNVVSQPDRADTKTVARGQLLLVDRSGSHTAR